jgi:hypothetical protein
VSGPSLPDPRELIRLLSSPLRSALEHAVARTWEGRRLQIEVDDVLVGALLQRDTDLAWLALQVPGFDAAGLVMAANTASRMRPTGEQRPVFSPALLVLLERALTLGRQVGWTRIRSAAALWALIEGGPDRRVGDLRAAAVGAAEA